MPISIQIAPGVDAKQILESITSQSFKDVLQERIRQITEECHTEERDDQYVEGELAQAGACYAMPSKTRRWLVGQGFSLWPFSSASCKASENTRRDLIKAAALIIAEIDRLDRAAKKTGTTHSHGIV